MIKCFRMLAKWLVIDKGPIRQAGKKWTELKGVRQSELNRLGQGSCYVN